MTAASSASPSVAAGGGGSSVTAAAAAGAAQASSPSSSQLLKSLFVPTAPKMPKLEVHIHNSIIELPCDPNEPLSRVAISSSTAGMAGAAPPAIADSTLKGKLDSAASATNTIPQVHGHVRILASEAFPAQSIEVKLVGSVIVDINPLMEEGESGQRHIREHGGTYKTEFYASEPAVLWPTAGSNKLSTLTSSLPFTLSLPVFQVPPSLEVPGIGGGNIEWKVVATLTLGKVAAIVSEKDVTGKAGASQQSSSVKANILSSSTLSSPAQNYVTTERVFIIRRPITTQTEPELGLFNGTSPHGELTYEVLLSTPIVIGPLNWKLWEASITVFPNALCIGRVRNVKCGLVTMVDFIPDSSEFLNPLTKTKALSAFLNAPAASESTLALFDAAASSPTASPDLPPSLSKFLSRFHKKDETYTPASPEIYEVDRAQERLKKEFSFGVPVSENLVPSVDVKNLKIYHKIRFTIEYITVENPFVQDVDTEEDVFADPPVETGKGEKKPAKKYKRRAVIDIPVLLIQGRVGETTVLGRLSI